LLAVSERRAIQCIIFDGDMKDAKLMGVAYMVRELPVTEAR